jgi:sec-independent protein translocase protein TatB
MFDIGWMELLLIGIVALIVVGPKDLPKLFRAVGHFMGKARGMAREFQRSMEQAADESGLREVSRDLNAINRVNLNAPTKSARKYAEGLVKSGGKTPKASRPAPAPAAGPAGGSGADAPEAAPAGGSTAPAAGPKADSGEPPQS